MLQKKGSQSLSIVFRDGSRTYAKSQIERFVLVINGWKSLTIIKKKSSRKRLHYLHLHKR